MRDNVSISCLAELGAAVAGVSRQATGVTKVRTMGRETRSATPRSEERTLFRSNSRLERLDTH